MQTNDLQKLLTILPADIKRVLEQHTERDNLIEVVMDLDRLPEARFFTHSEYLSETPITAKQLQDCIQHIGYFSGDNRAGIEQALHRISAIGNRTGEIIGLTCRVGRAIYGIVGLPTRFYHFLKCRTRAGFPENGVGSLT